MHEKVIDNPDLHLNKGIEQTVIKTVLEEILGTHLTIVTDLLEFDFTKNQPKQWVHLSTNNESLYPTTLSIYGIEFTFENAQNLAAKLNCQIITDYDLTLKQHQWQLINPDGSVELVVLED